MGDYQKPLTLTNVRRCGWLEQAFVLAAMGGECPICGWADNGPDRLGTLLEVAKSGRFCPTCGFWIAPSWCRLYGNTTAGMPRFETRVRTRTNIVETVSKWFR